MCLFPAEFQGEFMTQTSSRGGSTLQYAPISILPESIPVWGVCHRRLGNQVILMDRYVLIVRDHYANNTWLTRGCWQWNRLFPKKKTYSRITNVALLYDTGLAVLIASVASNWHCAHSTSSRSTRRGSINATRLRRRPWPPVRQKKASPRANRKKSCFTVSQRLLSVSSLHKLFISARFSLIYFAETKEMNGDPVVAQEYCPVNGRFVFTYSANHDLDDHHNLAVNVNNECQEPVSELSNCPYGFGLGLRFKRCSFGELGNRQQTLF